VLGRLDTTFTQRITFSATFHGNSMAVFGSSAKLALLALSHWRHSLPRLYDVSPAWVHRSIPVTVEAQQTTSPIARMAINSQGWQTLVIISTITPQPLQRLTDLSALLLLVPIAETINRYSIWGV